MATLYIEEYWGAGRPQSADGYLGAPLTSQSQPSFNQIVAITGSSTQCAAFRDTTILIRVHTDAICSVKVGTVNPTADTTCARMAANQTEYFSVRGGEKVAVISNV
jgi:hypothetical protein